MSLQVIIMSLDFESDTPSITKTFQKDEVIIGRSPACDIQLAQSVVSSQHLKLRVRPHPETGQEQLFAVDLGSLNGTLVEEFPLSPLVEREVQPSERIFIGNYLIKPMLTDEVGDTLESAGEDVVGRLADYSQDKDEAQTAAAAEKEETDLEEVTEFDEPVFAPQREGRILGRKESVKEQPSLEDSSDALDQEYQHGDKEALLETPEHGDLLKRKWKFGERKEAEEKEQEIEEMQEERQSALSGTGLEKESDFKAPERGRTDWSSKVTSQHAAAVEGEVAEDQVTEIHFDAVMLFSLGGVVTHHGRPLEGVEVDGGVFGSQQTGPDGRFCFDDIEESTPYELRVSKTDHVFKAENLKGVVQQDIHLQVEAQRLFSLSGRVVVNGDGLAGVKIEAGELGTSHTDENGYYCFAGVVEGSPYSLKAVKKDYIFECDDADGDVHENTIVNISAIRVFTISGVIKHHGVPLAGVEVDGGLIGRTVTDENGRYEFRNVPDGTKYRLTVRKEGYKFRMK
ncbi:MAG: FHA domain-containing protein [Deltaproteobacteria bacterium]|nr:FHA domain-containing protein [Deltaproteobacteria bacterium]